MTLRGRITLAALAGLAVLAGLAAARLVRGGDAPPDASVTAAGRASVAASGAGAVLPGPLPPALAARLPAGPEDRERLVELPGTPSFPRPSLVERLSGVPGMEAPGPLRIEYAFDAGLVRQIERVLRRARVRRGHAVVLDAQTGRVLAFLSTDPQAFPPGRAYPAASLVKVVTAAAALSHDPDAARRPCRYTGNPWRLRRWQLEPPRSGRGREVGLGRALATSNNQCFARLALHRLGAPPLLEALARFGWLEPPAPGHAPGRVDPGDDSWDLARLGSGLAGTTRITPLHAVQLGAVLATGRRVKPWWIHRVLDGRGRELRPPPPAPGRRVLEPEVAEELREMLVQTTRRGTARSAFLDRRRRPRLGPVRVAGKTGNLTGSDPRGRYEWFAGVAPAERPRVAVAVVQLHDDLWWKTSAEVAAGVLETLFCEDGRCDPDHVLRYTGSLRDEVSPVLLSASAG